MAGMVLVLPVKKLPLLIGYALVRHGEALQVVLVAKITYFLVLVFLIKINLRPRMFN
jgi:hypothetical protein